MEEISLDIQAAHLAREEIRNFYGSEVVLQDHAHQFVDLFHKHLNQLHEMKSKKRVKAE